MRTRGDGSCISTDEQMHGIPNGLSCDRDVGRAVWKMGPPILDTTGWQYLLRNSWHNLNFTMVVHR